MDKEVKFGVLLGLVSFPQIVRIIESKRKVKEVLSLTCPKCGTVKDLPYKHFLVAHRHRKTPFVVLCKCNTAWDIQSGNLSWVSEKTLERIAQYSKEQKEKVNGLL